MIFPSIVIIQCENTNSAPSSLDSEKSSLPTMPCHDPNKGEKETRTPILIPFDVVYS